MSPLPLFFGIRFDFWFPSLLVSITFLLFPLSLGAGSSIPCQYLFVCWVVPTLSFRPSCLIQSISSLCLCSPSSFRSSKWFWLFPIRFVLQRFLPYLFVMTAVNSPPHSLLPWRLHVSHIHLGVIDAFVFHFFPLFFTCLPTVLLASPSANRKRFSRSSPPPPLNRTPAPTCPLA